MADRYFVPAPIELGKVELAGVEAHHLLHVMRAKPGTQVTLFDGSGCEFAAVVQIVRRSSVEVLAIDRREVDREPPGQVILGVSLPKGDRQRWLVEKAVEVGVTRLAPLVTERSVAQPGEQAAQRLRRAVVEACKQCGRNRLPEIAAPQDWQTYLTGCPATAARWIAHPPQSLTNVDEVPTASTPSNNQPFLLPQQAGSAVRQIFLAVGPEGGFTAAEVAAAVAAGWECVQLGPSILRVETAAIWLAELAVQRLHGS